MGDSLLIKGGNVFDAEHSRFIQSDILIQGDTIKDISPDIHTESKIINAEGLIVSPGFIDCHSHSDGNPLFECDGGSKLFDGVTSEICGNCGFSLFPGRKEDGVQKRICPFSGTEYIIEQDTLGDYLDMIDAKGIPVNMGFLTGHGSLREQIAGRENRPLTREEELQMVCLFEEHLDQGSIGLSLGLAYPPGCFAGTEELIPLAEIVVKRDMTVASHIRNEWNMLLDSIQEFLSIGEQTGCRLQISHIKAMWKHHWDKASEAVEYILNRKKEGIDVTADRYTYTASSTGLDHLLPDYFYEGGDEKERKRLEDTRLLKKAEQEIYSSYGEDIFNYVQIVNIPGDHGESNFTGKKVSEVAEELDLTPFEAYIHLILIGNLRGSAVYHGMSEDNLEMFLSQEFVCVGSDARYRSVKGITSQGMPHPRAYGTFSRFLGRYVREKRIVSLEDALFKITAFPAVRFNLKKRGYLEKGYKADITVFNPRTIRDNATFTNPHQYSDGIEYVILNGQTAIEKGKLVSHTAGRVIRG